MDDITRRKGRGLLLPSLAKLEMEVVGQELNMHANSSLMTQLSALRDGLILTREENVKKREVSLVEEFEVMTIKHVYREANQCGNALAMML
ncbi:hypothetical protein RHMOL_Rhmol08G0161500 [Rhododendron molle]|uniref:Uncharacterized protein n=1 Tax=Rhododendron molle TaxID=49168 RepID=A0ACC0MP66_RHOML|nr:hypothetical protein RHMOL_Rhmol08G0161500 [Rhododendron molle]